MATGVAASTRTAGYTDTAVTSLRAAGYRRSGDDVARLSPLGYADNNLLGRYSFAAEA